MNEHEKLDKLDFDTYISDFRDVSDYLDRSAGINPNDIPKKFLNGQYYPEKLPNRNKEQVPTRLWRRLIVRHIVRYNYN